MKYKISHITYIILLLLSVLITCIAIFLREGTLNAIIISIGAGGIASVFIAWLLDVRNTKICTIENQRKYDEVMNQFVRIYCNMMDHVANECHGYCEKDESHSFQDWLRILCAIAPHCPKEGQSSMKTRCTRISGSIASLQRQIEIFQSQSVALIFADFPEIEQSLNDLEVLWIHCWGTLKMLEAENYTAFCDTMYILYTDFIKSFPQYQDRFPAEYSSRSFKP